MSYMYVCVSRHDSESIGIDTNMKIAIKAVINQDEYKLTRWKKTDQNFDTEIADVSYGKIPLIRAKLYRKLV